MRVIADRVLEALAGVLQDEEGVRRLDDAVVVAALAFAVLAEDTKFVARDLRLVGGDVAGIGVFSHELEGHLLPTSSHPDRDVRLLYPLRLVDGSPQLVIFSLE